jgi:plasmid stabilization system protein ParE
MKIVGDVLIIETSDPDELPTLLGGDLNPVSGFYFPWYCLGKRQSGRKHWKAVEAKLLQTAANLRTVFVLVISAQAETLLRFPHRGRLMRRRRNVRKLVCRPYLIVYRIAESQRKRTVEILRFWHGVRGTRRL